MILLNTDEHRQWQMQDSGQPVYIVIEGESDHGWEACSRCGGHGMQDYGGSIGECSACGGNTVQRRQGERGRFAPAEFHVPARWRVPVGEPCEIRAECPPQTRVDPIRLCPYCQGEGSVLLATGTVEILPVAGPHFQRTEVRRFIALTRPPSYVDRDMALGIHITLDPLPVPGRHFVAVITP